MSLSVDVDVKKLNLFLQGAPKKLSLAALRALKKATRSAHTDTSRVVAKDTGLKVGEIRKRLRRVEPNAQTLTGQIRASLRRLPLVLFGAKGPEPTRGRGRLTVRTKGRRRHIPHAFLATMRSGHRAVVKRGGRERLPVGELLGPSIGRVVDEKKLGIMERGGTVFRGEFDRLINRILGRTR